jgi:serine phosphatase RsbU (regulator of sigma subunit)
MAGGAIAIALVLLAAATVFVAAAYQQSALALLIERDRQVTYLSAAQLKDKLLELSDALTELARAPEMGGGSVEGKQLVLRQAASSLAIFDGGVVFLDGRGTVRAADPERPDIMDSDWSGRELFRRILASKSVIFSDATPDGPNGALVVLIGVPVFGVNGELVGALAGMFRVGEPRASSFYASIVRLRIGQSGPTLLTDGSGRILYDSFYGRVGQVLQGYDLGTAVSADGGGAGRLREPGGKDVIAALAPVPGTNWTLVTEDDWSTVASPVRRYAAVLLALLVVGVGLTVFGALLLVRIRRSDVLELRLAEQEEGASELIEEMLLPRQVPSLVGWSLSVLHRPVDGNRSDFYDFAYLPDGRLMMVVGDVTSAGVRGALARVRARTILRASARRCLPADEVLAESNDLLSPELEDDVSLTCQYSVLDPSSGRLEVASAGPLVPYCCGNSVTAEIGVSGSPLGVALGARYEPMATTLHRGERLVLYSPGLVSSVNQPGEAGGTARLAELLARSSTDGQALLQTLVSDLASFTGTGRTQKDDITVVVLEREAGPEQA